MRHGTLVVFLFFGAMAPGIAAESARIPLIAEPHEIYKIMLAQAERGQFEKVETCLKHLAPHFQTWKLADSASGERELRRVIEKKDKARLPEAVRALILEDMHHGFQSVLEGSPSLRRLLVRTIYMDYLVLDIGLRAVDPPRAREIRQTFKSLYGSLKISNPEPEEAVRGYIRSIEKKLKESAGKTVYGEGGSHGL